MKTRLIGISVTALLVAGIGYAVFDGIHDHDHGAGPRHAAGDGHDHDSGHGHDHESDDDHDHGDEVGHNHEGEEGVIHLTGAQIGRAGIRLVAAAPGEVAAELRVSGTVAADDERMVHVTTRVPGVVAELHKRLGEPVAAGDLLAVLESRDLADAKAGFLSALRHDALAATNLKREGELWRKKISAEQDYLDARTNAATARITLDAARQRLAALGLSRAEIDGLPRQNPDMLARLEIRSPIAGRVTWREGVRGELLAAEKEIFTIADLSEVWVELPVYAEDVAQVRAGQPVALTGPNGQKGTGRVIFAGPTLDPRTGAARVVASLDNADGTWRPGDFAAGLIRSGGPQADVTVPADAIQSLKGEQVVFVRVAEGFEVRAVTVGRRNSAVAEIIFGLFPGDVVASGNSFVLKAEASRSEAEHSHAH